MCDNSYIKVSPTTKVEMIYCRLFDEKNNDMEQICLYQRFCPDEQKYLFIHEEKCKYKDKLLDGAYKMQITL
jgi:hypothetical protein